MIRFQLFGIDNLSGEIVWQRTVPSVLPAPDKQLFVQRTTRHAPFPAKCTLLFQDKVKIIQRSLLRQVYESIVLHFFLAGLE